MHPTSPRAIGKIESGAFFANIGGCEIYGHTLAMRKFVAAIAHGGLDALAAFLDGVVWEADDVEVLNARGTNVNLNLYKVGVDSVNRSA